MLLPMDVLASRGKASNGSSSGGSGAGSGGRTSDGSGKCQLSLHDEASAPVAVHVSTGFSKDDEAAPAKGAPRLPADKGWSIGAGAAAAASADPAGQLPHTPATIHITANCRSSVGPALRLGGAGSASSPLEIAASVPSAGSGRGGARKAALVPAAAAGSAGGAAAEASVWQGLKALLADVDVAVFLILAFLMGGWRGWCGGGGVAARSAQARPPPPGLNAPATAPRHEMASASPLGSLPSLPAAAGIGNGSIGYLFLFLQELGPFRRG